MEKIYYTGLLTKNQSLQLLFAMEIAHELPKKKETVYIVAPIGHRDYTKILISVNVGKSTENKTLYKWEHYRWHSPIFQTLS